MRIPNVAALLAALLSAATPAFAQTASPDPAAASPVPAASGSAFVDYYTFARPGADGPQELTLRLRADGRASLRTDYPGMTQTAAGTPVTPLFETGTWVERGGNALVHLDRIANIVDKIPANPHPESIDLTFALVRCKLTLTADPNHSFGTAGATFAKRSCGEK